MAPHTDQVRAFKDIRRQGGNSVKQFNVIQCNTDLLLQTCYRIVTDSMLENPTRRVIDKEEQAQLIQSKGLSTR